MSGAGDPPPGDRPYDLDAQVGYLLRLVSQRHAAIFQAHSREGLTPMQFAAMVRIDEQGKVSQNHLGRLAAMDVATIKGVADRLHQKGLTLTERDPDDKRRMLISLSPQGAALLHEMRAVGHAITEETLAPLAAQDRRKLLELLSRLV